MRRYITSLAVVLLLAAALEAAQSARKAPVAKKSMGQAAAKRTEGATGVPSRATVESFLRHVFGWDTTVKWTIESIGPSAAPDIGDVLLHVQTPKGQAEQHIYITPDEKHAILGEMLPFNGTPGAPPSKEAIDAFVRGQVGTNPSITWVTADTKPDALSNLTGVQIIMTTPQGSGGQIFFVTADGKHALFGDVSPFGADPYAAARAELARGVNGPAEGPANAAVTIVEFGDMECPACKMAMPIVDRLLKDVPNTRLIFQEFPLTQIHKWADKAAEFGDCMAHENNQAFWKFLHAVYDQQETITDMGISTDQDVQTKIVPKLIQLADQAGVDGKTTAACAVRPETSAHIAASLALGKKMGITGTPTLFINGRMIANVGGMPYDTLKKITLFMGTPEAR